MFWVCAQKDRTQKHIMYITKLLINKEQNKNIKENKKQNKEKKIEKYPRR